MSSELLAGTMDNAIERDADVVQTTDAVEWLVDNAVAYDTLLRVIDDAQRFVWITQLAFDADCVAHESGSGDKPRLLLDALRRAANERGVDVRLLLNASLLLDTATPLQRWLEAEGDTRIAVRGIRAFPQLLHAKMVVADDEQAMLIGSPFVNGYWDDSRHRPSDDRRPMRELGGRPLHDLSMRITGSAVRSLRDAFAEMWNDGSVGEHGDAIEPLRQHADRPSGSHRIARTMPRGALTQRPNGLTEILGEIQAGVARAQRLIYVEHQYLSSRRIIAALVRALARAPELEIVVVLNQNPDVTAYRGWQNTRLREAELLSHPRVGVFALWSVEAGEGAGAKVSINQVFVHSKVVTVDDSWTTVGSANLDGVSLHSYGSDFSSWLGGRVFRDVRNFDVNLVVDERAERAPTVARELRELLWREHLGDASGLSERSGAGEGLARWRACAKANVALLDELSRGIAAAPSQTVLALPYSTRSTPAAQLADIGVGNVEGLDLRFDPGWLEVHFSPNWIRNMFA